MHSASVPPVEPGAAVDEVAGVDVDVVDETPPSVVDVAPPRPAVVVVVSDALVHAASTNTKAIGKTMRLIVRSLSVLCCVRSAG
jgi:hypothetical protein